MGGQFMCENYGSIALSHVARTHFAMTIFRCWRKNVMTLCDKNYHNANKFILLLFLSHYI